MSWPTGPEERYANDAVFHQLVDFIHHMLEKNAMRQWTPTELREAVMLACAQYEYRHVRPIVLAEYDQRRTSIDQKPMGMSDAEWMRK